MKLSTAIDGFLLDKRVSGCSPNTIRNYRLNLRRLRQFLEGDPELHDITQAQVRAFLNHLMTTRFEPAGIAKRPARRLSAKTIQNVHVCLSSIWTWATGEGYAPEHIVRGIHVPKPKPAPVEPFSQEQVRALLKATALSAPWERLPETQTRIPKRRITRDKAIILILLDTGIRNTELCRLTIADLDLTEGTAKVRSKGRLDAGRGKERFVRYSIATTRALLRYLQERGVAHKPRRAHESLVTDRDGKALNRHYLAKHLHRLGRRAGIPNTHAHRFRHTFAITYLRNGGDVYTLQDLLGHSSLEMVRRYAHIAQVDIEAAHRRASPVANWNL